MILSCPQCNARFQVPDEALQPNGRKVKCSACAHKWFQEPQYDEADLSDIIDAVDDIVDDITEQVEQEIVDQAETQSALENVTSEQEEDALQETDEGNASESNKNQNSQTENQEEADLAFSDALEDAEATNPQEDEASAQKPDKPDIVKQLIAGFAVFTLTALLVLLIVIALRGALIKSWPAMHGFYGALGFESKIGGSEIILNDIQAKLDADHKKIHITGELVNLSTHKAPILPMQAHQLDDHGHVLKGWIIKPPIKALDAGESTEFESHYEMVDHAKSVEIGFTLMELGQSAHDKSSIKSKELH